MFKNNCFFAILVLLLGTKKWSIRENTTRPGGSIKGSVSSRGQPHSLVLLYVNIFLDTRWRLVIFRVLKVTKKNVLDTYFSGKIGVSDRSVVTTRTRFCLRVMLKHSHVPSAIIGRRVGITRRRRRPFPWTRKTQTILLLLPSLSNNNYSLVDFFFPALTPLQRIMLACIREQTWAELPAGHKLRTSGANFLRLVSIINLHV